jgi:hypothetical protein
MEKYGARNPVTACPQMSWMSWVVRPARIKFARLELVHRGVKAVASQLQTRRRCADHIGALLGQVTQHKEGGMQLVCCE